VGLDAYEYTNNVIKMKQNDEHKDLVTREKALDI
jgi:hypothetical protein